MIKMDLSNIEIEERSNRITRVYRVSYEDSWGSGRTIGMAI